jgi:hypothetical protein
VPHSSPAFRVAALREGRVAVDEPEPFPDPLVAFEAMCHAECVIGFESRDLGFVALMTLGTLVVEVQRPDYMSQTALFAAAIRITTFVFVCSPDAVDLDGLAAVLKQTRLETALNHPTVGPHPNRAARLLAP